MLEIEEVIKFSDGAEMLDFHDNSQASFSLYFKELVEFIYKTSQTAASSEEDYARIASAYTTPAEKIIKLLITIKKDNDLKGTFERELNFAINKITQR